MIKALERLNDRQKENLFKTNEIYKISVRNEYKEGISIVKGWLEKETSTEKLKSIIPW